MNPRAGPKRLGEYKNPSPPPGFELRTVRPVASRFSGP